VKIKEHVLFAFYQVSQNDSFLHEWVRQFLIYFEVPALRFFLKLALSDSLSQMIIRHSLLEPQGFNVFMSDIDITLIVKQNSDIPKALKVFYDLKKIFLNLGEPEVFTQQEWEQQMALEEPEFNKIWANLFQVRKIFWQKTKQEKTSSPYEIAKIQRGLEKSYSKLHAAGSRLFIQRLFPNVPSAEIYCGIEIPFYSEYLNIWVEASPACRTESLICSTNDQVEGLIQLIPGHKTIDPKILSHPLRRYFLYREILLSRAQLRIQQYSHHQNDAISGWITRLETEMNDQPNQA
jgi:hypothetical protein